MVLNFSTTGHQWVTILIVFLLPSKSQKKSVPPSWLIVSQYFNHYLSQPLKLKFRRKRLLIVSVKGGKGKVICSKLENLWEKYYHPLHSILKERDAQGLFGTEHRVYELFSQRIRDINFATGCCKNDVVCFAWLVPTLFKSR